MPKKLLKYLRPETFPTPFCPGCGHGILLGAILRAVDELALDINQMVFVSGIGCAAWIPSPHFAADTMHTTHGRPIAFATGIKLFNPKLKVVVISGDGDLAAIGGNHLIHAARRNIPLTVICADNYVYGMTGGQLAPTTPQQGRTSTTPDGSTEPPFDLCRLVKGASPVRSKTPISCNGRVGKPVLSRDRADFPVRLPIGTKASAPECFRGTSNGVNFIARTTVFHTRDLIKYIKTGFQHPGFAFIDVISPCFTQFGRRNKATSPAEMILALKKLCIKAKKPGDLFSLRQKNKILTGIF